MSDIELESEGSTNMENDHYDYSYEFWYPLLLCCYSRSKRMHCTELTSGLCPSFFTKCLRPREVSEQAYVASKCQVGKWTQPLYVQKSSKAESGARANCRPNCNYIRWQIFEYHAHLGALASPQGSLCLLAAHAVFET